MTFGFGLCTVGSMDFSILQCHVYKPSPYEYGATTCAETLPEGADTLPAVSYAYYAILTVITAVSEIFNMKGLVSWLNLFTTAIAAAVGLATAPMIRDPFLIWAIAGPTMVGGVLTVVFWFTFRHIDRDEFVGGFRAG
ncbi:Peptide transporter PTR2 [Madurella mycetomatis]|uniref:Peptide transporter PTR2 n=1 Tax=Madurella mycetomatis TaxID=100816 RepID=A0A175WBZ0_9PEZI|nr:Peptide transporter PTR2 [Madurella mycetomatis]